MDNATIKALEAEERELMAQLESKRAERLAAITAENNRLAQEKLSKPITITVTHFAAKAGMITVENDYREDIISLMRKYPSRAYRGDRENIFNVSDWSIFEVEAGRLRNVSIEYVDGIREMIDKFKSMPSWEISLEQRWLHAVPGPTGVRYILRSIPGVVWNTESEFWQVPLTEGWKLAETLTETEGVVWDEAAADFVKAQAERRAKIDSIATQKESAKYMALDLNGERLYPFQSVGAEFVEVADGRAIIGDEMGLGKTPEGIAYAVMQGFKKIIVVCPANLKPNWGRAILKFTGLRPRVWNGLQPTPNDMVRAITEPATWTVINYDILGSAVREKGISGYKESFVWAELINLMKPDLVIVDEGHYIKNIDSNRSKAVRSLKVPRIVFLTGTPVLNRPAELWPMLHMIAPGTFPAYDTFIRQYTIDGKRTRNPLELKLLLKNIMIRRLKSEVLPDLPPLNRVPIYAELSPKAVKLYNKVLEGIYEQLAEFSPTGEIAMKTVANILVQIMRLKQICAIDMAPRSADLASDLYDQTDENSKRKVIIFSQFKPPAYSIYQRLADQGALCFISRTPTEFKTANINERDKMVLQFQTDPAIKYLIVTEQTMREGHDATAAGHVIFNDLFWTPANHDQACGRAYGRMIDLHGLDAYFNIAQLPDEEEESIGDWGWELLGFKQGVIDETIEGVHATRSDNDGAMAMIQKIREAMWTKKRK